MPPTRCIVQRSVAICVLRPRGHNIKYAVQTGCQMAQLHPLSSNAVCRAHFNKTSGGHTPCLQEYVLLFSLYAAAAVAACPLPLRPGLHMHYPHAAQRASKSIACGNAKCCCSHLQHDQLSSCFVHQQVCDAQVPPCCCVMQGRCAVKAVDGVQLAPCCYEGLNTRLVAVEACQVKCCVSIRACRICTEPPCQPVGRLNECV
jgi:hypothetical protein